MKKPLIFLSPLFFSSIVYAESVCVDLNGDGDTDDLGECIWIEDDPPNPPEIPELEPEPKDFKNNEHSR